MIHILKIWTLFVLLVSFSTNKHRTPADCEKVSVSPRGQFIQVKCSNCSWVRIEYSTTDWRCRNGKCEKVGTVTWHDVVVDARNQGKIFYYRAAAGPTSVSEVAEASVLDCSCQ